uniref:Myb-like domain-containing protein n=1 Tax=Strigamia maritima TaxID=126957 RepID=T1J6B0_STRMM
MDENQTNISNIVPATTDDVSQSEPSSTSPPTKRIKMTADANQVVIDIGDGLLQSKSELSNDPSSSIKIPVGKTTKKNVQYNLRAKKTSQKKCKQDAETDSMMKGQLEHEIDELLEEKSWKNNLSAINVKNILRHVITNEHVLAMVRNTMKEEKQPIHRVPWPISPIKKPQGTCKIMETEFSEEENSSDEEYTPEADEETDLDKSVNSQVDDSFEKPPTPQTEPQTEENIETNTEMLAHSSVTSLTESFEQLSAGDTIACRTRSKLPLTDTLLESIESSFVAPDITTDMYDSVCDDEDWVDFLHEFVMTPRKNNNNNNNNVSDVGDDDTEDPEYNFLEDNEVLDREDLRDDRAVKITKKELSELMAELFEAAEMELDEFEEDENSKNTVSTDLALTMASKVVDERDNSKTDSKATESLALIGRDERLQLDEQMRKHVQLLVQACILATSVEEYQMIKEIYFRLLIEIQAFAIQNTMTTGYPSAFNACNLTDGVILVTNYVDSFVPQIDLGQKFRMKTGPGLTHNAKGIFSESKVLIYPELLPVCGFSTAFIKSKVVFSEAEDNLLAMGLDQFFKLKDLACHKTIREHMLPAKTEKQIRHRIKNLKSSKMPDNPVKFFFQNGHKLPPQIVKIPPEFNASEVKSPKKQPINALPLWLRKSIMFNTGTRTVPIMPTTDSETVIVTTSTTTSGTPLVSILRTPEKTQNSPAVTNNRISPLKQISPILKKYSPNRFKKTGGNLSKPKVILPKKIPVFCVSPAKDGQRRIAPKEPSEEKSNETVVEPIPNEEIMESNVNCESVVEEQLEIPAEKGSKVEDVVETDSQSDVELFDDDEEPLDNAEDLAALMAASTTIQTAPKGKGMGKRCSRLQRDIHAKLQLLASDLLESDPLRDERETAFAQSYLLKVKEVTKNHDHIYESFLKLLYEFGQSDKSAVQLHSEVCKLLKDYPQLCTEFVAFLMPEQAMECGKLLEFLQFKQMRLFLRKLEIQFDKNPQHMQKVLKTLAQCQEHINLGFDNIKNIIQPLFRGRAHLMEEFLQLFPSESASENLMTDYEEITLPDSDGELDYDGYESITLPEDKHDYGGKNCQCRCHTETQDLKLQKRIRHCIPCGTKFIDGRIYIQTGKSLRPARVIYLNSEKSKGSTLIHSTEQEPEQGEPTSPCSESSSVSSLSPTDLKDSEEEKDVVSHDISHDVVTEEISPDLRRGSAPDDVGTPSSTDKTEVSTLSAKNHSVNERGDVIVLWTKAADCLILKTCQQLGVTDVAFQIVSHQLGNKTVDEVRERFSELIRLFSVHASESGSESETEEPVVK